MSAGNPAPRGEVSADTVDGRGAAGNGEPIRRDLGRRAYGEVWSAMRRFTAERGPDTTDELWLVEHPPVFTQGRNGRAEHPIASGDIPVVHSDRGGQVTYHGPGQAVAYPLVDLRRSGISVREYVTRLEQGVIELLAGLGLAGFRRPGAPGIFLDQPQGPKVASLGLRVRSGCAYHGVSLNVANDLAPFARIHPCGFRDLAVTRLADRIPGIDPVEVRGLLGQTVAVRLSHPHEELRHG